MALRIELKAISEQGERLNIRKATLRQWREEFANQLRRVGVAANATPRFVRGETRPRKPDGIYRAARRGASTHMRDRVEAAASHFGRQIESVSPPNCGYARQGTNWNGDGSPPARR